MRGNETGFTEVGEADNTAAPSSSFLTFHLSHSLPLHRTSRFAVLGFLFASLLVFGLAFTLEPDTRGYGTHQQLGLPECSFLTLTGKPCPTCGMTTSFSALVAGNLFGSLHANWMGTLLAIVCLLAIPWAMVSLLSDRFAFFKSRPAKPHRLAWGMVLLSLIQWCVAVIRF